MSNMASLVKDGLEKLWKESPLKFDNFEYVPQDKVDSLKEKFPKNFTEKTWDTDDEQEEDLLNSSQGRSLLQPRALIQMTGVKSPFEKWRQWQSQPHL